jgi:acyl dehydratase
VKWLAPVRPDDRLRVRATVLESRASDSRPEMGLVKFLFEMFNQADVAVMSLTTTSMFGRRTSAASQAAPAGAEAR